MTARLHVGLAMSGTIAWLAFIAGGCGDDNKDTTDGGAADVLPVGDGSARDGATSEGGSIDVPVEVPFGRGTLMGVVLDLDVPGPVYLAGATVETEPAGLTTKSDEFGRFSIANVPAGTYRVKATVPGLTRTGNDIVPGAAVVGVSEPVAVVTGGTVEAWVQVRRVPENWNMVALMSAANLLVYKNENCIACHTARKTELSLDPKLAPFHSMPVHSLTMCTFCHVSVEVRRHGWDVGKTAAIRKSVKVSGCKNCHLQYPTKF